jgi:hypothetical protein
LVEEQEHAADEEEAACAKHTTMSVYVGATHRMPRGEGGADAQTAGTKGDANFW